MATDAEHPNVRLIREFTEGFRQGDVGVFERVCADDMVWHIGGNHMLSGNYRGHEELASAFQRIIDETDGNFDAEPIDVMADDRHLVLIVRVTAQRGDKRLDVIEANAFKIDENGKLKEAWWLSNDQAQENAFWS
jgi:ketosteroid isomerase-like protein